MWKFRWREKQSGKLCGRNSIGLYTSTNVEVKSLGRVEVYRQSFLTYVTDVAELSALPSDPFTSGESAFGTVLSEQETGLAPETLRIF